MALQKINYIVKKRPKEEYHPPHGTWKIAYADFVTAMMAFFLLLWILSAAETEVLNGVSNYFIPSTVSKVQTSGYGGVFGGDFDSEIARIEASEHTESLAPTRRQKSPVESWKEQQGQDDVEPSKDAKTANAEDSPQLKFAQKRNETEVAQVQIIEVLKNFDQSMQVDIVKQGVQIRLNDTDAFNAFFPGSAILTDEASIILDKLAQVIKNLDDKIVIAGFPDGNVQPLDYWKLAINRADAVRSSLVNSGLEDDRFISISGAAILPSVKKVEELNFDLDNSRDFASPIEQLNTYFIIYLISDIKELDGFENISLPPSITGFNQ